MIMNNKLTYEEWRSKMRIEVSDDANNTLKELHGIDAREEIESALKRMYEEKYLTDQG